MQPVLTNIINRVFTPKIDRYSIKKISAGGVIKGLFWGRDRAAYQFDLDINKSTLNYKKLVGDKIRHDAVGRRRTKKQFDCQKGTPCKGGCIPKNHTCRDKVGINSREKAILNELVEDRYSRQTIRDLQAEARTRGVYRYNHKTKGELIDTLKILDQNPKAQENLRKTLEKRRAIRTTVIKGAPSDLAKTWKSIETVSKAYKQNPDMAGLIIAAGLMGVASGIGARVKGHYKTGLTESADLAYQRSLNTSIDRVNKDNITFAVGGFGSTGSKGERITEYLSAPLNNTKGEKWFGKKNHFVNFNHTDFDIPAPGASKKNGDGSYNPIYLGSVSKRGFGKFLNNFKRQRNEASVELASKLYAYSNRYPNKPLNVLAHGVGGNVVDEATEILARMRRSDRRGRSGQEMADGLNIVRLGTPYFGMTDDARWKKKVNHRTVTSTGDPFSILPKKAAQFVNSVKGAEVEDYLGNLEVREKIRETFGYYSSSLNGQKNADLKRAKFRSEVGDALKMVNPGVAAIYSQINKISDRARENPTAAAITGTLVVTGLTVAGYKSAEKKYQDELGNAATLAMAEVQNTQVKNYPNKNLTFVVGGTGQPHQEIVDNLPSEIKGTGSRLTGGKTKVIIPDGITASSLPPGIVPGSKAYYAYLSLNGFGAQIKRGILNQLPGRAKLDPEAIRLAAQLYAYGNRKTKGKQKFDRLNVIAAGDGAVKARTAMEILARMGKENNGKIKGKAIAQNKVRLASLGSNGAGFTNQKPSKYIPDEIGFSGTKDFFSNIPHKPSTLKVTPEGVEHGIKNYLKNELVIRTLIEKFYS